MDEKRHTIFITGCSGYVGAMLVEKFLEREDVDHVVGLDKDALPDFLENKPNFTFISKNMSDSGWEEEVSRYKPDIVVHTAWQIREMYGKQKEQWKWNVEGTDKVFAFAFSSPFVKRLTHFSTVAVYGAESDNTLEYRFVETDSLRENEYLYGVEKRVVEEHLQEKYAKSDKSLKVSVVRPAAITGPRGRFMRTRFGLQSALSGQLKDSPVFTHRLVSAMVSVVPITRKWCRQFIHEDDVVDIVELLAFESKRSGYEVFNICPPGGIVVGRDMAKAVGKRSLLVSPWMIRLVYFLAWHVSKGKIPTSRGGWKFYSYPVAVDGSLLTQTYGYKYGHRSHNAFTQVEGRYAKYVK